MIFAEKRQHALELLNLGRNLAVETGTSVSVFVSFDREDARELIAHGADKVLILPTLPPNEPLDCYVPIMVGAAEEADPDLIIVSATYRGKQIAARVAGRLDTGLCSGCTAVRVNAGQFELDRLAYGGTAVQTVACTRRPAMVTIAPGLFESARITEGKPGEVKELPAPLPSVVKVLERRPKLREVKTITEAKAIVCAGRGIGKEDDLALVQELARLIGGEIACTRPLSEELHWLPEELCVGLSGVSVKPDLYLGIGVSGQIQHVTGIRNSKVIAAVNKDEKAPIFEAADLGIVGDLYDIVPKIIQALKNAS